MTYSYAKLDDQWCISAFDNPDAVAGQVVTVTKRNGESKQVTLGDKLHSNGRKTYYAIAERPRPSAEQVGDLSAIMTMFDKARASHSKRLPAIVFADFRINVAGDRAKEPGSLTITSGERGENGRDWFGRITKAGVFEPSRSAPEGLGDKLRAFAADPAGVAAQHGTTTNTCCFCNTTLRHPASKQVGYGPDCAKKFGLPWGK